MKWPLALAVLLLGNPLVGALTFDDQTSTLIPESSTLRNGPSAWGDYNNDGWVDLFSDGQIWRNVEGTGFLQHTPGTGFGGRVVLGDYDNDGYIDAFGYTNSQRGIFHNDNGNNLTKQIDALPTLPMASTQGASWADYDNDGFLDLYVGGYEVSSSDQPDVVLHNEAGESFTIAWQQSPGDLLPARGITSADFDRDGDMDVYVSNYRLEPNLLMENQGDGTFQNIAQARGVDGDYDGFSPSYGHTIGSAWGDLDNDGYLDLFVGNFSHPPSYQDRSKFYKNLGPSGGFAFMDMSGGAGLAWQESYTTPALVDYDNDGDLDLYFATTYEGDHGVLYRNNGNWTFTDVTAASGLSDLVTSYQAAWADFNNDGFPDLVTDGKILVNQGNANHWLKVDLRGDGVAVNRDAVGAQVIVHLDDGTIVMRQVEAGTGQGNQNEHILHFGMGTNTAPVSLEIFWPNGDYEVFADIPVDNTVGFTFGAAVIPGDTDADGDVDLDDYNELSGNMYTNVSGGFDDGDFDLDGDVDFEDFVIQALNFGKWPAAEEGVNSIPEPALYPLLVLTVIWRRRKL